MLSAEQIESNWNKLLEYINKYISEPRKSKLIEFYKKFEDRIILMPAAHKSEYHNCFPGGYVDHVLRVVDCCLKINNVWEEMGVDSTTYTIEELVFSAINHDLGKIGDDNFESYIPQTDEWRKEKLGEQYTFNTQLPFTSVPDRGLFLLQSNGINYTFNEMLAILTHDGLYDESNKKYLISFSPEQKPRTSLLYIVHQGDLMAARIEWEKEWLSKLSKPKSQSKSLSKDSKVKKTPAKDLSKIKSPGLASMLNDL